MIVKSKCCLCISVFLVFVLGNIERAGAAPMFDASELYEKLQPSLCAVLALDETGTEIGYGSGFVITKSGDVVTNAHVIAGAVSIKLECNSRIGKALNIARFSPGLDLVVLSSNLSKSSPLNIVSHLDLKPGSLVFALGNPLGFRSTITTGLVSGVRSIDGVDYIQLSADINPGNSGGPIVTQNGEVIGVATMRLEKTQRLSFALPADHIHNLGEVNYSFSEKAIMSDVKVRNNELFISELLFRGLSLGSECEEILSLEGVHLPPSSEEALKLLLGSQLGFSDEGVWNNISLTGSNSGVTQLLGKKVGVNFECRFGKLVSATYMIRENIVNNVNLDELIHNF